MAAIRNSVLVMLLAAAVGNTASAQIELGAVVVAAGGGLMSGGAYTAAGTVGQPVIGRSIGTNYTASAGFWGDGGAILDVERPIAEGVPEAFTLDQNYPNPFNPITTIIYELPQSSMVKLTVYDLLGRAVTVLLNEKREAGIYEVRFDATNLPSGAYIYRLEAGEFVATRRLVVLK